MRYSGLLIIIVREATMSRRWVALVFAIVALVAA